VTDLFDVALVVARTLEACGVPYSVGGSLASSLFGEPRASVDADIVADLAPADADALAVALGDAFYVDRDALRRRGRLDEAYLASMAGAAGVSDLLLRVLSD
jgi:hypothetical protein